MQQLLLYVEIKSFLLLVFNIFKKDALLNFIHGEEEGTLVTLN